MHPKFKVSIEFHPCLQRSKTGKGSQLRLKVNFLPEIIQLSKEVRNLKSLGFRVPLAIVNKAHQVRGREGEKGKKLTCLGVGSKASVSGDRF